MPRLVKSSTGLVKEDKALQMQYRASTFWFTVIALHLPNYIWPIDRSTFYQEPLQSAEKKNAPSHQAVYLVLPTSGK